MTFSDPITVIARNSAIRSRAVQEAEEFIRSHIWALENAAVNELYALYGETYRRLSEQLATTAIQYGAGETWSASDLAFRRRTDALLAQISAEIDRLSGEVMDRTLVASVRGYQAGYYGGAWQLEQGLHTGAAANLPFLPTEAIRAAVLAPYQGLTFVDRFTDIRDEFIRRVRRALIESQIEGESIYLAQKRLADALGVAIGRRTLADRAANAAYFYRTELIARTEILRASNLGAMSIYEANQDVLRGWQWRATHDERTCFPGVTQIQTESGLRPIAKIVPGENVLTRQGFKKVLSKSERYYEGPMTLIVARRIIVATFDHPFWTPEGWQAAHRLKLGDSLLTSKNEFLPIERIENYSIGIPPNRLPGETVYNLTIEDVPEFYAEGCLVHNCPICGALDGQQFKFAQAGGQQSPPPTGSHSRCRCTPLPVLIDSALEARIVGERQTYREWAAQRGITIAYDGGALRFRAAPPPKSPSADAVKAAPHLYPKGA